MIRNADAWHHTNKYYVGSEDLDANGRWENAPDYVRYGCRMSRMAGLRIAMAMGLGALLRLDMGGLLSCGRPASHYGRWMYYGNSWAWWPGPVGARLLPSLLGAS